MEDFDLLRKLWQQPVEPSIDINLLLTKAKSNKNKLLKSQLRGAALLILTGLIIAFMAVSKIFVFESRLTYWGMTVVSVVPILQGVYMLILYKKMQSLDITESPAEHLKNWENYFELNKRLTKMNMPLYFILLNLGFVFYSIELLSRMSILMMSIVLAVYVSWMLYSFFYLGKKALKKQTNSMTEIINNLKLVEKQLQ